MPVIVQKFGGTSVADPQKILRCANRVIEARRAGYEVVVVVSAMGHTTDELIDLADQVVAHASTSTVNRPDSSGEDAVAAGKAGAALVGGSAGTPVGGAPGAAGVSGGREMDMLMSTGEQVSIALMAIALKSQGFEAISMTGWQMGMLTNDLHGKARIQSINVDRLRRELAAGRIVVAAGFQGITPDGEITTLGRGGSDTTAVALAAALGVREGQGLCEIFTDVDGVYTADPRQVRNARKLSRITYDEMLELASQGAAVMHNRSVMFGQKYGVPIHVRHSQKPDTGTIICKETPEMEDIVVAGCALKRDLGRISLRRIPNQPGVQGMVFDLIASANIVVDDIIQTQHGDTASLSFTVDHADLAEVKLAAGKALEQLGTGELAVEIGLAKVSVAGVGMRSHAGVAATMFRALGQAGINIANITTSEIKISCIVPKEHGERALQVVHDAFELDKTEGGARSSRGVDAAGSSAPKNDRKPAPPPSKREPAKAR